ncbi:MAG TPA: methionine gamma-lyase family protein, partial [Terriglobales bacterium]|nr:methionine gamma-lyase family protein [Terriglobales bacterium]
MELYPDFSFSPRLLETAARCEQKLADRFTQVEATARYNSQKVHAAFIGAKVSETHFIATTGYGYGDRGREVIDKVYARIFKAEAALVRHFMLSGTHALTTALFGTLRPGDTMLSVAGKPYDTLDKVIGFTGASGSLMDFGIRYAEVPLADGRLDYAAIEKALAAKPKMAYLQRSRGYAARPSIFISEIEKVARLVHTVSPDTIFMVDN